MYSPTLFIGRSRRLSPLLVLVAVLGCEGDPQSPSALPPTLATGSTQVLVFRGVSTGFSYSCGVTTDDMAYCWGDNSFGQLGNGTTSRHVRPSPVAGGLRFREVSAGRDHTCGVTTTNKGYCWGFNFDGQLGDGTGYPTNTKRLTPVAVVGGHRFRVLRPGADHTCGVTTSDVAFCWGWNNAGQLGDGTRVRRLRPARVLGGLQFRIVTAGGNHSCGVTRQNRGYCWGFNNAGQLGIGTFGGSTSEPVKVARGLTFIHLNASWSHHTCGVTRTNRAYCWGNNIDGQLGDGTTNNRSAPRAVVGGVPFDHVSTRANHTCAVTPTNVPYCWGYNVAGQLGDGTFDNRRLAPIAVAGGIRLSGVWAGQNHSCGVTSGGKAYCWGANFNGQVGDGTADNRRLTPVAVAGPI